MDTWTRDKYRTDPEFRAMHNKRVVARRTQRYREDPAFATRVKSWSVESEKRRRATPHGWAVSEIRKIKSRCKGKGTPFDLVPADLTVPDICPVLGIPLVCGGPPKSPNLPSVDRRIAPLGYVKGNVTVISWRANFLKNDCVSGEELRRVAAYIDECTGD